MVQNVTLRRLHAACIDGRTANLRYRQTQLQSLHEALVEANAIIRDALHKDNPAWTVAEVDSDFAFGISALRDHFKSIHFHKGLRQEYNVTRGESNTSRTVGVSVVILRPDRAAENEMSFFTLISPLVAALAVGSIVILQTARDLRHIPSALFPILSKAVDTDIFGILDPGVDVESTFSTALVVQTGDQATSLRQLSPGTNSHVVALVDRTADVDEAARALLSARKGFGGKSSYAPTLVLVNAFVKERFMSAVTGELALKSKDTQIQAAQKLPGSEASPLVDLAKRCKNSAELFKNMQHNKLYIADMTSIDDGIDFLSTDTQLPYRALYIFSDLKVAKYLAQYTHAEATFVNHIPHDLLLGPPAPFFPTQPISIRHRYTPAMFEVARPEWVLQKKDSCGQDPIFSLEDALKSLPPTKQPLYHASVGFFEQAILISLSLTAVPIFLCLGTGIVYGMRHLWRRYT